MELHFYFLGLQSVKKVNFFRPNSYGNCESYISADKESIIEEGLRVKVFQSVVRPVFFSNHSRENVVNLNESLSIVQKIIHFFSLPPKNYLFPGFDDKVLCIVELNELINETVVIVRVTESL